MKRLFLAALTLSAFFSFAVNSFGLEVPPRPSGHITDLTNTLVRQQIADLEAKLSRFEAETTNQIAVLLIPTLSGDSLEDYSIRLAEKWKIGQAGKDNGVILLIVKNDRKLRIEVGYGLEGTLPDALAKIIISEEISPLFRQGDFYGGIARGLSAIMQATKGEYKGRPKQKAPQFRTTGQGLRIIFPLAFILFVMVIIILRGMGIVKNGSGRRGYSGYYGGGWGSSGGGGGGGFSGGGGSFGGGGASGSW